jgi:hypothetical protein
MTDVLADQRRTVDLDQMSSTQQAECLQQPGWIVALLVAPGMDHRRPARR